jgi:phosphopantothenoylcysteine decarboxylase / phosphopantothenate---cysteine ligase
MHPVEDIRGSKSQLLKNKKIVLGVTGSIAAVETIKLARELIRHGAEIIPVMTLAATKIIHPDSLWFATGNKAIVELSGATEHVSYCGKVKNPADMLLICPCTANTISKIAYGIDDTSVTTFATTAIGSKIPVIIVPAMHLSMYYHKIIQKNIKKLKKIDINFIEPLIEKNKAKMPDINKIAASVIRILGKKDLSSKKILIIGGPASEKIDDVRVITNRSSGKTAVFLAKNAFYRGADVEIWYGAGSELVPDYIKKTDVFSVNDILKLVQTKNLKKYNSIIVCSAISDYIPIKQKGKISSDKEKIIVELKKAPKIISLLRKKSPKSKIIGFKVEDKKEKLSDKAMSLLKNNNLDYVIGNTISGFESDENEIWIFDKTGKKVYKKGKKENLTNIVLDLIK